MFAKVSLTSFMYDITDIFCFPDKKIQNLFCIVCFVLFVLFALFCIVCLVYVYKCFVYLLLMDTDSTSLQFIFVSQKKKCSVLEEDASKLMFEIAIGSKIFECLCRSHE